MGTDLIAYLDLTRPKATLRLLVLPLMGIVFALLEAENFLWIDILKILLGSWAAISAGMCLNDLLDQETDQVGKEAVYDSCGRIRSRRPLVRKELGRKGAFSLTTFLMSFAVLITLTFPSPKNWFLLLIGGYTGLAMFAYSRIRRHLPLGGLVMASIMGVFPVGGYVAIVESLNLQCLILFTLVFFWELGPHHEGANLIDLENDLKRNIKTIPSSLGLTFSLNLMITSSITTIFASFLLFWVAKMGIIYFLGALGSGFMLMRTIFSISKKDLVKSALREFKMAKSYLVILLLFAAADILIRRVI